MIWTISLVIMLPMVIPAETWDTIVVIVAALIVVVPIAGPAMLVMLV